MDQLGEEELMNLSKKQLVSYILDYRKRIDDYFKAIKDDMCKMKDEIRTLSKNFEIVESDAAITRQVNSKLQEKIISLERHCSENDQYSRRESVEISGLPESIKDDVLEEKVLEVFGKIGVFIDKSNVEACHRLKSKIKPNKTIIKLSRRKDVSEILTNKKKLKDKDLTDIGIEDQVYINES